MKPAASRRPAGPPAARNFDPALALGEAALALWLWFAVAAFTGGAGAWWPKGLVLAAGLPLASWLLGLHRPVPGRLARFLLLAPVAGMLLSAAAPLPGPAASLALAGWFGVALAAPLLGFHLALRAARALWPGQPGEVVRWLIMGGAGVVLLLPYYGRQGLGSGDAYWYVAMMADVVTQLRHGILPVWVGQSEYAFNGAVSPLRLAPWLQYAGGLLDLITLHRLEPTALKNAVIAGSGLALAASAYLAVRGALPRRPGLACALALLWLASPGVLATVYVGDQYMQWMALPFLPPLLYGCGRLWTRGDTPARVILVAALAGLMLAHTPTALWGGLLAAGFWLGRLATRRDWPGEARALAWMGSLFLVMGGFPIGAALTIDNPVAMKALGRDVLPAIAPLFPGVFRPIDGAHPSMESYQVGYTLLAAGLAAAILLAWRRPSGAGAFVAALLALVPLAAPVPFLSNWLWSHAPSLLITINGTNPPQRLYEFWGLLMVFALALALAEPRAGRRTRSGILLALALLAGGLWSAREAAKLVRSIRGSYVDPAAANVNLRPENRWLTRYAYASFSAVPNYASHSHVDPALENRLLDRRTLRLLASNADAAAPQPGSAPETLPRLAQSGTWTATSDTHSRIYWLTPSLVLQPGQRYALRLDFLQPEKEGYLQITNADLFREYLLPDSGHGLSSQPPRAFGSLPTSSHVAGLEQDSPRSTRPVARFIQPAYSGEEFEFARFWLFTYDLSNLPIRVSSWIPYTAEAETALPAFLETPRVWQRGWKATVNGRPAAVQDSPQHLVMVPLDPGTSHVVVTFHAPVWLAAWFWICLGGWAVLLACGARRFARLSSLT